MDYHIKTIHKIVDENWFASKFRRVCKMSEDELLYAVDNASINFLIDRGISRYDIVIAKIPECSSPQLYDINENTCKVRFINSFTDYNNDLVMHVLKLADEYTKGTNGRKRCLEYLNNYVSRNKILPVEVAKIMDDDIVDYVRDYMEVNNGKRN